MELPQIEKPQIAQANLFGVCYAMACILFLPLYMKNGYVDMIYGKYQLMQAFAWIGVVGIVGLFLFRKISFQFDCFKSGGLWLVLLCASYIVATIFSESQYTAIWGFYGRQNGLVTFLSCTVLFFVVKALKVQRFYSIIQQTICVSGGLVALLGWLNYWNIDPFGVYYSMANHIGQMFLSTIGNINFFGGFLCLCVPFAIQKAIETQTTTNVVLAVLIMSAFVPANSDGAWIGAVVCVLAVLCSKKTNTAVFAWLCKLGAFSCMVWVVNAIRAFFFPVRGQLRTVSALVGNLPVALLGSVVLFALFYLSKQKRIPVRKIGFSIVAILVVGMAAGLYLCNFTSVSLGGLDSLFKIDQTWGSNRGYVWYLLMLVYGRFDWIQKLFGAGADTVYSLLNPKYTDYIIALNGSTFDSAHNEFLQHLVCGGLVGVVAWIGFLFGRIKAAAKAYPAIALGLMGYAVQSFFSISMPAVFPLVFVIAALVEPTAPSQTQESEKDVWWIVGGTALIGIVAMILSGFLK